jgi:hypothetical protein
MKRPIKIPFAGGILALTLFGIAAAGELETGQAAYRSGDYANAIGVPWRNRAMLASPCTKSTNGAEVVLNATRSKPSQENLPFSAPIESTSERHVYFQIILV